MINGHRYTLAKCLGVSLRILAPITPYLSDDLYSRLSKKLSVFDCYNSLLESSYPNSREFEYLRNTDLENQMRQVIQLILSIRASTGILSGVKNKNAIIQGKSLVMLMNIFRYIFHQYYCVFQFTLQSKLRKKNNYTKIIKI